MRSAKSSQDYHMRMDLNEHGALKDCSFTVLAYTSVSLSLFHSSKISSKAS